ncbi:MAG: TIR domain-containing protein [Anaerolineae bacterium]|nr:TIR domain-containing protein [Anaerolineae bacterium]
MADVFISYAREDTEFVRRISDGLVQNQRDTWVDWEDIPLTADWLEEAYAGIEGADAFVFIISPASIKSGPCMLELEHALENNKRLIPILRREVTDPDEFKLMHPSLSAHNWVKCREVDDYDQAFQSLLTALDTDLDYIKAHTRYVVRSAEWEDKGRDPSLLLRGTDLREAESWLKESAEKQPSANELQRDFIMSSRGAANQRRRLLILGTMVVLAMTTLAIFALFQRQVAVENAAAARAAESTAQFNAEQADSFALAANAQQLLYRDNNTDLAIALALEANRLNVAPPLARSILAQAAFAPGTRDRLGGYALYPDADMAVSLDSRLALSVKADDSLELWELETGEVLHNWTFSEDERVRSVAFSPDGQRASVTLDGNGPLLLLDLQDYAILNTWTEGGYAVTAVFTADSSALLAGYGDGNLRLWDVDSFKLIREYTGYPDDTVYGVAISPDQKTVAAAIDSAGILLWDFANPGEARALEGHNDIVRSVEFSPDGTQLISASNDATVRLWDVATGETLFQMVGHTDRVRRAIFSPDGEHAFSASQDSHIIEWDPKTGQIVRTYVGHVATVYAVFNLPDNRLLTGSSDGTLRIWDTQNGAQIRSLEGHGDVVYAVAISPDGTRALSGSQDRSLLLWDLQTGEILNIMKGHTAGVRGVTFSPDGTRALSTARDRTMILWDLSTGQAIRTFNGHDNVVWGVAFSPDGRTALTGSWDNTMILWDLETGRMIRRYAEHTARVYGVAISPDGKYALSGSSDKSVILWDLETGAIIHEMQGHDSVVYTVAFSSDGRYALSGSLDLSVILWDLQTGTRIRRFDGHTADVTSVRFSSDGQRAISGSLDKTVRLWDVQTGVETLLYAGHNDGVWSVALSPDDQTFISGSIDRSVREWRIDSLDEVALWTYANRYIEPLSCEQRDLYRVAVRCDTRGLFPTATPYATNEPTLAPTLLPTPTSSAAVEAVEPTVTPTLTPLPEVLLSTAVRGDLAVGGRDLYTFVGRAGDVITVNALADQPANGETDQVAQVEQGLLDINLTLFDANGFLVAENDNVADGLTDALIAPLVLPADGVYTVQINNINNTEVGGPYTLLIEPGVVPTATPTPSS